MTRHSLSELVKTGIAPKFFPLLRFHRFKGHRAAGGPRHILVDDAGAGNIAVIDNGDWSNDGTITSGVAGPDGNFVDAAHNLYEADYVNLVINEFAHAGSTEWIGSSPSFVYSTGLTDPIGVATDTAGNVYAANWNFGASGAVVEYAQGSNTPINTCSVAGGVEGVATDTAGNVYAANWNFGASGAVVEYAQGSNTPINTCSVAGGVEGVALDSAGDVFASVVTSGVGSVVEWAGGLSGCSSTTLPISFGFLGGMASDKAGNLLVCDQTGAVVDVIAPPYTSITGTLGSGYSAPFHVTVNKQNKVAYVADDVAAAVDVLSYPSGTLITTLTSANGLVDPYAAVYGANGVY